MHTHTPHDLEIPRSTRRWLAGAGIAAAALAAIAVAVMWPRDDVTNSLRSVGLTGTFYDARVDVLDDERRCDEGTEPPTPADGEGAEAAPAEQSDPGTPVLCPQALIELLDGPDKGRKVVIDYPATAHGPDLSEGEKVVVSYDKSAPRGFNYAFADRQRKSVLVGLALLFALVVIALGRARGLAALVGLAASVTVLLMFILPAILDGRSPVIVAIVGASAIAVLAIYLAHGFNPMATVALLGTLASLALTAALAAVFTELARFSGFATEEATLVNLADARIDLVGLTLGGMVIGALGAIDDMTVTQASAVAELHAANPSLGARRLYGAALRIGRDHVASTVNTLALAYAGASMPILLLFLLAEQSLGTVANGEILATELVRTLVGSIGLVAAVPITTALAAWISTRTDEAPSTTEDPS